MGAIIIYLPPLLILLVHRGNPNTKENKMQGSIGYLQAAASAAELLELEDSMTRGLLTAGAEVLST